MRLREYEVVKDKDLTPTEVAVVYTLNVYMKINIKNKNGAQTLISQELIAEGAKIKRPTACRIIKSLEEKGWLIVKREGKSRFTYSFPKDKCFGGNIENTVDVPSSDIGTSDVTSPVQFNDVTSSGIVTGLCAENEHIGYIDKDNIEDNKLNLKTGAVPAQNKQTKKTEPVGEISTGNNKVTVNSVFPVWKETILETFDDIHQVSEFTSKEKGMMKSYINKTGGYNPGAVLKYIISNWSHFISYISANKLDWPCPSQPKLGFILKNADHTVNYYLNNTKSKALEDKYDIETKVLDMKPLKKKMNVGITHSDLERKWNRIRKMNDETLEGHVSFDAQQNYAAKHFVRRISSVSPIDTFCSCVFEWESFREYMSVHTEYKYLKESADVTFVLEHPEHAVSYFKYSLALQEEEDMEVEQ